MTISDDAGSYWEVDKAAVFKLKSGAWRRVKGIYKVAKFLHLILVYFLLIVVGLHIRRIGAFSESVCMLFFQ